MISSASEMRDTLTVRMCFGWSGHREVASLSSSSAQYGGLLFCTSALSLLSGKAYHTDLHWPCLKAQYVSGSCYSLWLFSEPLVLCDAVGFMAFQVSRFRVCCGYLLVLSHRLHSSAVSAFHQYTGAWRFPFDPVFRATSQALPTRDMSCDDIWSVIWDSRKCRHLGERQRKISEETLCMITLYARLVPHLLNANPKQMRKRFSQQYLNRFE